MSDKQQQDSFEDVWKLLAAVDEVPANAPAPSPSPEPLGENESPVVAVERPEIDPAKAPLADEGQAAEPELKPGPLLHDIGRLASWQGKSEEDAKKFHALQRLFLDRFPEMEEQMRARIRQGKRFGELKEFAYKCGCEGKAFSFVEADCRHGEMDSRQRIGIADSFKRGLASLARGKEERDAKKKGLALSTVRPRALAGKPTRIGEYERTQHKEPKVPEADLHPNDLRSLKPSPKWMLVIDESGNTFDAPAEVELSAKVAGRFVGVLVPSGALPPLKSEWHAVRESHPEIDRVVQAVLDAPVGILGVEVASVPFSPGERWLDGVALLLDWVLRLMPVEGPVDLEVLIERRGDFHAKQPWDVLRRDCLYRLAMAFPERASRIRLSVQCIRKDQSGLNGYADALAFTWAKTTHTSKERLKRSGLANRCLLADADGFDSRKMLEAWDTFSQGVRIEPARWWDWVRQPSAREPSALLHGFLNALARECLADALLWQALMAEVKRRMAQTPVDLPSLAGAVDWLQGCKPESESLPSMARMVWLTVRHARANHEGQFPTMDSGELESLENALFDEAAPLVCHAQLHRAVQRTNGYAFAEAEALLLPWLDHPVAVPGLRYHAHVWSSLGQHAAFQGRHGLARKRFEKALAFISQLSDPTQALLDEAQTRAYLAISMMDDPGVDDGTVWGEIIQVIGPLEKAAALSRTPDPARRYSLHLLMRALCKRGNTEVEEAVIACRNQWAYGEGHPWPLIQAYRGLLLLERDPAAARQLLRDGAELAERASQGPTVALIGACLRNLASTYGDDWAQRDSQCEMLSVQIPAAADRIALLRHPPPAGRAAAMRFLSDVLPFNFH